MTSLEASLETCLYHAGTRAGRSSASTPSCSACGWSRAGPAGSRCGSAAECCLLFDRETLAARARRRSRTTAPRAGTRLPAGVRTAGDYEAWRGGSRAQGSRSPTSTIGTAVAARSTSRSGRQPARDRRRRPVAGVSGARSDGERTLSERELNRALLARQLLLERSAVVAAEGARADRRDPGAVRAVDVRRALDAGSRASSATSSRGRSSAARSSREPRCGRRSTCSPRPTGGRSRSRSASGAARCGCAITATGRRAEQMAAAARRVRKRLAEGPVDRKELQELIGFGPQGITGINALARPGPGTALGHLGAPPGGSFADAGGLARRGRRS